MQRTLLALIFLLLSASTCPAGQHPVTVTRTSDDFYAAFDRDILIKTRFCSVRAFQERALLSSDRFGELVFTNGTRCTVDTVYARKRLRRGTHEVTVTREGEGVYRLAGSETLLFASRCSTLALRDRTAYALPLGAALLACWLKQTAWVPAFFVFVVLLRAHPRHIPKTLGAMLAVGVLMIPFVRSVLSGRVSTDDFTGMDATARAMGYWARQAYAYLGHWLVPGPAPRFNVPVGGADGGGIDGLGPVFRIAVWAALAVMLLCRKRLSGWGTVMLVCWAGVLTVPTLYIGYARYTPLIYPAVMLPLVLVFPRLAMIPAALVCAMPAAWIGWRVMRSTENLYALSPAVTAVHATDYNVRCGFRDRLSETPQPILSGSLVYSYAGTGDFPPMPRAAEGQRLTPAAEKARGMLRYAVAEWLPYAVSHLPETALQTVRYRWRLLTAPRGESDGIQNP